MKVNQSTLADDIFISVETLLPTCSFPTYHAHNVYEIYILNSGNVTFSSVVSYIIHHPELWQ